MTISDKSLSRWCVSDVPPDLSSEVMSSFIYRRSVIWSMTVGLVAAVLGTIYQAFLDERVERRLQAKGIMIRDAPVRPRLLMECVTSPHRAMELCKDGLQNADLRIKSVNVNDPLHVVATTRASFYSFRERITAQARSLGPNSCELEM
jgi:hypothetical protein